MRDVLGLLLLALLYIARFLSKQLAELIYRVDFLVLFFCHKIFCTKNVFRGSKRAYETLLARGARVVTNE